MHHMTLLPDADPINQSCDSCVVYVCKPSQFLCKLLTREHHHHNIQDALPSCCWHIQLETGKLTPVGLSTSCSLLCFQQVF